MTPGVNAHLPNAAAGSTRPWQVRVLGEAYTPDDEEDSALAQVSVHAWRGSARWNMSAWWHLLVFHCCAQVTAVWAYQARYRVPLTKAAAGSWVLLGGVDATISKTGVCARLGLGAGGRDAAFSRALTTPHVLQPPLCPSSWRRRRCTCSSRCASTHSR